MAVTPLVNSLSVPTKTNSSSPTFTPPTTVAQPAATSAAPVAPTYVPGSAQDPSVVDYLKSIGAPSNMAALSTLGTKLGIVDDPTKYTGTADQNTALLTALRKGQGSTTGNSVGAGTNNSSGSTLGAAITANLPASVGGSAAPTATTPGGGSSAGTNATATPTGSGTITPDMHTDDTGAFDPSGYSAAALADSQDSLNTTLQSNTSDYTQAKSDLDSQFSQWKEDWTQQKEFAMESAQEYGGSYANEVGQYYDKMYAQQAQTYQQNLGDLASKKSDADSTAQNAFNTDKQSIAANVANFGMNQEQFDQTQTKDAQSAFNQLSTTFNYAPTPEMASALSNAGITEGMDASKLTTSQKSLLYNLAPDFFDTGLGAGKSFAGVASDFLSGTYKAQAAQLAAQKAADAEANATATQTRLLASLANTESYDQSREQYYDIQGAQNLVKQYTNSPIAKQTAQTLNSLAQIKASSGVNNAAGTLDAIDAFVTGETGGKPTAAQIDDLEKGTTYEQRLATVYNNLKANGATGSITPAVAQELRDVTLGLAKQRVIAYTDQVYDPAQTALANSPYAGQGDIVPDYQTNMVSYLNGDADASAALDASLTSPSDGGTAGSQTVDVGGSTYNVGQIYNDGTSNWTVDAQGNWTQAQ